MDNTAGDRRLPAFAIAAVVGTLAWIVLVADFDAARPQSYVNTEDPDGPFAVFAGVTMIAAPAVLGALFPGYGGGIGLGLMGPAFLLAPWTAPRGDGDGLWVFVFFYLVVMWLPAAAVADFAGWVRRKMNGR